MHMLAEAKHGIGRLGEPARFTGAIAGLFFGEPHCNPHFDAFFAHRRVKIPARNVGRQAIGNIIVNSGCSRRDQRKFNSTEANSGAI